MSFFRGLQDSGFSDWVLGSDSIWAYPTVLTLHTVGMAILVGAALVINLRALRIGGGIPPALLRPLHRVFWIGFGLSLLSGVVLFVTEAADRVAQPVFYVKLASVALALWAVVIVQRRAMDAAGPLRAEAAGTRWLAMTSLALWAIAIVAGRLMAYLAG